eukprot:GHVP01038427.1.p1 GENE.GHVP01038427.1~~GHVP01038427.1.p1  ORF type:complete len:535 (+),score=72.15 GHVP01038427.1:3313-4917(+)
MEMDFASPSSSHLAANMPDSEDPGKSLPSAIFDRQTSIEIPSEDERSSFILWLLMILRILSLVQLTVTTSGARAGHFFLTRVIKLIIDFSTYFPLLIRTMVRDWNDFLRLCSFDDRTSQVFRQTVGPLSPIKTVFLTEGMPVLKEIARSFSTTFIEISAVILEIIEIGVAFVTWTKDVILEMFDKNQNSPNYYPESPVGKTYFNAGDSTSSTIGTTKDHMFSPTVCPVQLNLPIPPSAGMSPITLTPPSEGPPSPNFCHMNSSVSSAVFGDRSRTAAMQSTSFKSDVGNWKIGLAKATSRVFDDRNRPGFDAFQSTLHQINGGEVYSDRHYCVTKDGYLLVLQHLQRYDSRKQPSFNKMITIRGGASTPLSKNKNKKKSTIVFFHALYESCVNWIITGKNCLPLQCLKSGHDVWVANNRGNLFSCKIPDDVLKGANDALPPDLRYDLEVNNNPKGLRVQFQERNSEEEPKTPASLGSIGENLLSPTNSSITNSSPTNFSSLRSPDPNGNEIYRQLVQMCDCPPCRIEGFDTVLR